MNDVTVLCACGRKMGLDSVRGRGAFRCGCGVRVTVTAPMRKVACLGGNASGQACQLIPASGSDAVGIPLCADHLEGHQGYLRTVDEGERWGELMKDAWEDSRRARTDGLASRQAWEGDYLAARRKLYSGQSVVYYIRVGDLIKIGVTTNMKARMPQLMPDEILATEPGGPDVERARQAQFAHLKVRGERFEAGPELTGHIAKVRETYGAPEMTGYLLKDRPDKRFGDAL
ncbi:MAG: hypothetical protein ABR585_07560 [Gemmatimonadaceae bacterium]